MGAYRDRGTNPGSYSDGSTNPGSYRDRGTNPGSYDRGKGYMVKAEFWEEPLALKGLSLIMICPMRILCTTTQATVFNNSFWCHLDSFLVEIWQPFEDSSNIPVSMQPTSSEEDESVDVATCIFAKISPTISAPIVLTGWDYG